MTFLRSLTAASVLRDALDASSSGLDDLAARVVDVAGSPVLAVLLAELAHAPGALAEVAARSYWHSNGFAKIVLAADDDPEGGKLRLHVWPESVGGDGPRGESDPHGHRWDFASTVLVGGLDVVEHQVVERDGELFGGYEYHPRTGLSGGIEVLLRPGDTVHRSRGDVYRCGTDVLHTVEPSGTDVTATLVVQGPVSANSAWVYLREPTPYREPPALRPDELANLLALVLGRL